MNQWFFPSNFFILQVFLSASQSKKETQQSELLLPSINKVSKNTFGYLDLRTSLFQSFVCSLIFSISCLQAPSFLLSTFIFQLSSALASLSTFPCFRLLSLLSPLPLFLLLFCLVQAWFLLYLVFRVEQLDLYLLSLVCLFFISQIRSCTQFCFLQISFLEVVYI